MTDALQRKTNALLPPLSCTWERTSVPEYEKSLPIGVTLNIANSLTIHAKSSNPFISERAHVGPSSEEFTLVLDQEHILGADIYLTPDISERDARWLTADLSIAVIRQIDPFNVVPYFEHVFTTNMSYWFKALANGLREYVGVQEVTVVEETAERRKKRLLISAKIK